MTARRVVVAVWALSVAACVAGAVFAVWNRDIPAAVTALLSVVVPTAGAVVARHVPRNPVGWAQLAGGVLGSLGTLALEYGPVALAHGWPDAVTHPLVWFSGWAWLPALAGSLVFTALFFPDGRLVARGFRPVVALAVAAVVVWVAGLGGPTWSLPTRGMLEDTAVTPSDVFTLAALGAAATLVLMAVAAAVGLVVRWRRADSLGRMQLKWFAAGLSVVAAFVVATELVDLGSWQNTLGTLSIAAVAVAIAVAVLRYRLYEIDTIVSRTVSYVVVLAVLAGVYVGIVLGAGVLVPQRWGSLGVVVATLAVTTAFLPLSRRVRRVVDRRFDRTQVDRERVVARYAEHERGDVRPELAGEELLAVTARTVAPAHVGLWLVPR